MALPPCLLQLRAATQPDHTRLEQLPRLRALAGDDLRPTPYAELLALYYGYYEPLERQLAAHPLWTRCGFDFEARRKLPLIARDLTSLGWSDLALAALPRHQAPPLGDDAQALGRLYVLEGATLGGQILARHVRARLGYGPACGAAFFGGYGEAVGPMWQAVCRLLVAHCGPDQVDPALVNAARATFAELAAWLSQPESVLA